MIKKNLLLSILVLFGTIIVFATPTKSLTFNGTNQYVRIPNSADFRMNSSENLSISFWVKTSTPAFSSYPRVIGYRLGNDTETAYEIYTISGKGYACTATGIANGGAAGRLMDIGFGGTAATWNHIAIVFDRTGGSSHVYINGVENKDASKDITTAKSFASTTDILLGAGWNTSRAIYSYFSGAIANVRFYKKSLTVAQVTTDMNTNNFTALESSIKSSCVAAYEPNDDFTSMTLTDLSGKGNNGVLNNYLLPVGDGTITNVTVTQNTDFTGRNNATDPILRAAVDFTGKPAALNSIKITLNGTTNISDYRKIKIYSTKTSSAFDERKAYGATLLGELNPATGTMICPLTSSNLVNGTNYLWIVADVAPNAVEGNKLDATIESLITANETYAVTSGSPAGNREILIARKLLYAPGDGGSAGYRIPSMVIMPNGNLVTAIDRRWFNENDLPNKIDIITNTSEDGGYTWSNEYPLSIATNTSNGRGDCAMVVAPNGDILAAFVGDNGLFQSTASNPISSYISRSSDGGKTWSPVIKDGQGDITKQIWGATCGGDATRINGTGAFFGSGRGLCLTRQTGANVSKNGRVMFVTAIRSSGNLQNYVVYSDDNGTTWKVSSKAFAGGDEAKVAELNDGTILMSIRRNGQRGYNRSTDGGETWGTQGTWSELSTNACNGDILEYTAISDGYEKNRTLQSLPINDGTNVRKQVCVYLSYDEGMTWTRKKQMFPSSAAYSTMVMFEDGTIGMYAEDIQSGTRNYFMRFSLEWLTDGADKFTPIKNRAKAPSFNPVSGTIFKDGETGIVNISCETANSKIYYTTDNSTPTPESAMLYEKPINVTQAVTIKAIATADKIENSIVSTAVYKFPEYCTTGSLRSTHDQTSPRILHGITFTGGEQPFSITDIETDYNHIIYHDLTNKILNVRQGATVNPSLNWTGQWMHAYIYIDFNNDKIFTPLFKSDATPKEGSELISYSYYAFGATAPATGKNSLGADVSYSAGITLTNVPHFVIPASLPIGLYRMRVKIDWCNADACGENQIENNKLEQNGASIVDLTVNVTDGSGVNEADCENMNIIGTTGKIIISGAENTVVQIYNNTGRLVKSELISGNSEIKVENGFYIVRINGITKKVIVK
ncbi:MAG: exo-alpha-sialidase [Bacteroidales bacterium]